MQPDVPFTLGLIAFVAGAVFSLSAWHSPRAARLIACALAIAGSVLEGAASIVALSRGGIESFSLPYGVPVLSWTVRLDPLSAYFNLTLATLSVAISVYSLGYLRHMEGRRNVAALGFLYNVLLASLTLVFTAGNTFLFLFAWELMAVSAFCLVTFEHEKRDARRAGVLFFVMSHAGGGLLLIAFLTLAAATGSVEFSSFHLIASKFAPGAQAGVFLLFLAGFGVKAGIVPLHIWLPDAHPVAPSNISALMSGIVIKTGIYGIARVCFDFYGAPPLWMGTLLLALGVISGLIGVLYALMEHDLKRLLAYHSIENIGIILIGFGAALIFRSLGQPNLAAIALIAGLYHTLNHAMFKGLLFLGAGSVVHSVKTRNMEQMGGLIRRMPVTAFTFLIGAVAISGLPPLNGFVSEWLTYQALLSGFGTTESLTRVIFPIAGALLALTAALAAACFVKAFAIPFLALPKSDAAADAEEAPASMRLGMLFLAAVCIVLGLGATWVLPVFDPITQAALGVPVSGALTTAGGFAISAGTDRSGTVSTAGIALLFIMFSVIPALAWRFYGRARRTVGPTWDCGLPGLRAENSYTATAFSKALRMIFAALYRPRREIQAEYEVSPYYPTAIRFESEIEPAFEKHLYDPLKAWALGIARKFRAVQAGSIHAYLAYIFVTLVLLLLFGVRA